MNRNRLQEILAHQLHLLKIQKQAYGITEKLVQQQLRNTNNYLSLYAKSELNRGDNNCM